MALSKRLRYEVLRRDGHACRYCGRSAPDVPLTVDHVVPVALGGHDEPSNLVTACRDCNSGKSASSPDAPLVADVAADALRWAAAMDHAAALALADVDRRNGNRAKFVERWNVWKAGGKTMPIPADWEGTVDQLCSAGLPMELLLDAVDVAMRKTHVARDQLFRYMCGVAWRRIAELQDTARVVAADRPSTAVPVLNAYQVASVALDSISRVVLDLSGDNMLARIAEDGFAAAMTGATHALDDAHREGMDDEEARVTMLFRAAKHSAYHSHRIRERAIALGFRPAIAGETFDQDGPA
jgi:HNH endonuclease